MIIKQAGSEASSIGKNGVGGESDESRSRADHSRERSRASTAQASRRCSPRRTLPDWADCRAPHELSMIGSCMAQSSVAVVLFGLAGSTGHVPQGRGLSAGTDERRQARPCRHRENPPAGHCRHVVATSGAGLTDSVGRGPQFVSAHANRRKRSSRLSGRQRAVAHSVSEWSRGAQAAATAGTSGADPSKRPIRVALLCQVH